jgi:hypothetical protein
MKNVFAVVVVLVFLAVAPAKAQSEIQPEHRNQPQLAPKSDLLETPDAPKIKLRSVHPDHRFLIFAAVQVAATIADAETTQWALHSNPQAGEMNPLFGRHPDRARMYGVAFSITAV